MKKYMVKYKTDLIWLREISLSLLLLLMSLIWRKFEECSKCAMSTVTGVVAYVIKNVFSRVRNTDSDMSSRNAAGKLFNITSPWIIARCQCVTGRRLKQFFVLADEIPLHASHLCHDSLTTLCRQLQLLPFLSLQLPLDVAAMMQTPWWCHHGSISIGVLKSTDFLQYLLWQASMDKTRD